MKLAAKDLVIEVRPGTVEDIPLMLSFIRSMAEFEKLQVAATEQSLRESLFDEDPAGHTLLVFVDGAPAAYAVYCFIFESMVGTPVLWLDDLYVEPTFRRQGIASALMAYLADVAMENDCGRFEWMVLDWNAPAIDFYSGLGATILDEWRICRLDEQGLASLAEQLVRADSGGERRQGGRTMQGPDPIDWLLEEDGENPGVRYFALTDLLDRPTDDAQVIAARRAVMTSGPVPAILDAQYPEGFWVKPGGGYSPKYRSTVWQIIFLAELGADLTDGRVRRGCEYLLSHSIAANGAFSCYQKPVPSGAIPCLNGNLLRALQRLGYADDPRVGTALDWQARAITGEGSFQYLKSGTAGPSFACSANEGQPCAWGGNKAMCALLAVPSHVRTPAVERAIEAGASFLLSRDPAVADYPYTKRVSSTWFKLGFPLTYWSDVLETTAVLVGAGYGEDPRLANAFELILSKQDDHGRWQLENSLHGKMWADIEEKQKRSKWVTLRALRVLKEAGLYAPAG